MRVALHDIPPLETEWGETAPRRGCLP
jgi:hypothetical protein